MGGKGATDLRIASLAGAQHGVAARWQLVALGLGDDAVDGRLARGRLHPLHRGVYAVGHAKLTREGACLAAVKACGPTAVLSHYSAAALYELVRWHDRYPEVTAKTMPVHSGIRVYRSQTIDATHHNGIPITKPSPAWAPAPAP